MEWTSLVWEDKDEYFIHVSDKQIVDTDGDFIKYRRTFYIVDENALIIDIDDGWYKMERVSYIEGYPDAIQRA